MLKHQPASEQEVAALGLQHRRYLPQVGAEDTQLTTGVLLVHGRAGNEEVPWVFSKAFEQLKPITLAPRAIFADPIGGFSWWLLEHGPGDESPAPRKTSLGDLDEPLDRLYHFILAAKEQHRLERIVGLGFSQGAALLASLSLLEPELFTGVGILSGFIPGVLVKEIQLPSAIETKYFIAHGTRDEVIPFSKALETKQLLESLGAEVIFYQEDVTHKVGSASLRELRQWIEPLLQSSMTA